MSSAVHLVCPVCDSISNLQRAGAMPLVALLEWVRATVPTAGKGQA